jgi:hypothetical protein
VFGCGVGPARHLQIDDLLRQRARRPVFGRRARKRAIVTSPLGFCSAALSDSSVIDRSFVTPNAFGIYLRRICNSVRLEIVPVSF